MWIGWGARRAREVTTVVLAAWFASATNTGCSASKGLPVGGSGGAAGGGAGRAGGAGGAAGQAGGSFTDASGDRLDAGPDGGETPGTDASDAFAGDAGIDGISIPGLVSIEVAPASQTVALSSTVNGVVATATFTATGHFSDGHTEDFTERVAWPSDFSALTVTGLGVATVSAPGSYTVRAAAGAVSGTATLVATFSGNQFQPSFDPAGAAALDGTPTDIATIAYPLNHAVVPPNLTPLPVHVAHSSPAQTVARLHFTAGTVLDLNYYAACQSGPGIGCYLDLPEELTRFFIAVSENTDVTLIARVGGAGAALAESPPIQLAWANVPLSGGLYYWTALAPGSLPNYVPPDNVNNTPGITGAGILRYDFGRPGVALPQPVYTDMGPPPFYAGGSPPATSDGTHCIGCHAISSNGKTMALAVGGSNAPDLALLDLTTRNLTVLDAAAAAGAVSPSDPNYYKQFRISGVATETAFGPNGDVMVNMYRTKLFLRGTTASLVNEGEVAASFTETYKSDPFWSQSGRYFVFTSFAVPDIGTYNFDGLNGDMKRGGQIAIASATATGINDDAHVLVPREPNVTKFYPAVSNDDALVVYSQSNCGIDPDVYTNQVTGAGVYGAQTCDGYDDSSASIWLTSPTGMTPVRLDRLNGGQTPTDNARPQWGPSSGKFRGQRLYWVAFSSRRPYGLQLNNGAPLTTRPQLWLGAVTVGAEIVSDPSFAPVWLPSQNTSPTMPNGNHTPQWARVAVKLPSP